MKKTVIMALVLILCFSTSAFAAGKQVAPMKLTKDGITVEVTSATLEEIKGDRTKDNYRDDNGEYFANGSNIVKAADYRNLVLKVKYTNGRKTDINFPKLPIAWTITLPGGEKEKDTRLYTIGKNLTGKVKKNSTVEDTITLLVKKPAKKDGFVLTYSLLDYNDEFNNAINGVMSGKISKKEWDKKYKKKFTPVDMIIKLQVK
ncbi:hypothetical protein M5X00_31830 [Paenibacillus alvei]|uniref:hypothetical protein n=1 Tax=Paenibacillus alvei TaxID=44250 RepID=UPI0002887471|nr:hypothetical protein [Paenibacillus alvei]EJW14285.1 hypothetical protein PAV_15c00740 [Paenibacillus alvei DSM 29]MCY9539232.1 hypothetical protein [Paenibacillus alvei]MCY9706722.1 hypothetical protein [Paenibacillus alvei]MCY9736999.1 hypothetical protein [Paenibacillus alvei]MCY9758809.1 hypothetical protein [Paenibacillus alvei]